jgi:hypothetical protein
MAYLHNTQADVHTDLSSIIEDYIEQMIRGHVKCALPMKLTHPTTSPLCTNSTAVRPNQMKQESLQNLGIRLGSGYTN